VGVIAIYERFAQTQAFLRGNSASQAGNNYTVVHPPTTTVSSRF
jgi:hypothetical protein